MKRLTADDPVRLVRMVFGKIDDQAIDQVFHQGIGGVGVGERFKIFGALNCSMGFLQE